MYTVLQNIIGIFPPNLNSFNEYINLATEVFESYILDFDLMGNMHVI